MAHAKFQSPSINIDRYFQLSAGERKKGRKAERKGVSKWRYQDVELRLCPKGKGGAKNQGIVFKISKISYPEINISGKILYGHNPLGMLNHIGF